MKKILIVIMVIDILLLLCYCSIKNTNDTPSQSEGASTSSAVVTSTEEKAEQLITTTTTTLGKDTTDDQKPEEQVSEHFASYESILNLCRTVVYSLDTVNQNPRGLADGLFGLEDSTEKEWFLEIYYALSYLYRNRTTPENKLLLGYAIKDLNHDGVDELVLMDEACTVGAVFSTVNGKPVLLRAYEQRDSAWIDANGWLHENGSNGADHSVNAIYKIAAGGASLDLVAEFGTGDQTYYQLIRGEKKEITEAEFVALEEQYGKYLGSQDGAAATKEQAGLSFVSLFPDGITVPAFSHFTSYDSILRLCRTAINEIDFENDKRNELATALFGASMTTEKDWFFRIYDSLFLFHPGRGEEDHNSVHYKLSFRYSYKDLNRDGIDELVLMTDEYIMIAIFSMADGKPVLLGDYQPRGSCWIDENGWLHINGSGGADYSHNTVYKIATGGASFEVIAGFGTNGTEWIGDEAVTIYYKLVNGEKVRITEAECNALEEEYGKYLGYEAGAEATKEKAGLSMIPLFHLDDTIEQVFEAALNNEIKVTYGRFGEEDQAVYLKDYVMWEYFKPFGEFPSNSYALIDVDGDDICELAINSYNYIILRYDQGKVYLYEFSIKQMHALFTDGTICGHDQAGHVITGYKLSFDGTEVKEQELWKDVYDSETDEWSYYIKGEQVSIEERNRYFEKNPNIKVEFISKDLWENRVSPSEALVIAKDYWHDFALEKNELSLITGYDSKAPSSVYVVHLRKLVMDSHLSTIDWIWIDKITGKVIIPGTNTAPDGVSFLSYDVRNTWKEDLITLLSQLDIWEPENSIPGSYAVGLMDLNFDNTPEALVAYPGGSMGNIWVHIYNLKNPKEPIWFYDGAGFGGDGMSLRLTVAKVGDDYVVLAEGSIRGRSNRLELLSNLNDLETKKLETKELFGVGDSLNNPNQYFYMGERVEKSKYDEEYQKFLNDYTVFEETEITLAFWSDYDLSNKEQLVRDMAEKLLHSTQKFIYYQK
ncbi:MAG: hypothetical protein IKM34_04615 [Clostridia bacterium]|nr:hypothetical protein [Clostridia bacterium]